MRVISIRRPHCWTYRAEIWHGGPHLPREVIGYILYPNPQGQGALKTDFAVVGALQWA